MAIVFELAINHMAIDASVVNSISDPLWYVEPDSEVVSVQKQIELWFVMNKVKLVHNMLEIYLFKILFAG